MVDNVTAIKISQFDGTNFSNWKYRVGILLDERKLRTFIEKDIEEIVKEDAYKEDTKGQDKVQIEEKNVFQF